MKKTRARHDKNGGEILDPTPREPPLGYRRQPTLAEQIRQQVLAQKLEELESLEETDDEADDFEVGDDWQPSSPHENENAPTIKELKQRAKEINDEIKRQNMAALKEQLEAKIKKTRGDEGEPEAPPLPPSEPPSPSK